ncbi:MAG: NAD-dependent epimerase/dehydratase family protein [Alicyclobacillaceae bacterium]|nr:NAD-dependent epimerase/dehydratase family protein [Alicyclobacillaceae bacterium]
MILVTGADGYIGWVAALRLAEAFPHEEVVGIDNLARRRWVRRVGGVSVTDIAPVQSRLAAARRKGLANLRFRAVDLRRADMVTALIRQEEPRAVVHLAAQPSAPFAGRSLQHIHLTYDTNNGATRNLVFAIHAADRPIHLVMTTTMGIYGAPNFPIPEGRLHIEIEGAADTIPYPGMATSWYHMSKAGDANTLYLAHRLWQLPITELRTAITYGINEVDLRTDPDLVTRLDCDSCFGVVLHRFCAQAVTGRGLTIYGQGQQKKPFISVESAARSIVRAVERKNSGEYVIYNQVTDIVGIEELARWIQREAQARGWSCPITHVPNPRVENETHQMVVHNEGFLRDLGPFSDDWRSAVGALLEAMAERRERTLASLALHHR